MAFWPWARRPPFGYGYSPPPHFQHHPACPTDPSEALKMIDKYESAAERAPDSIRCFKFYEYALDICCKHTFIQRAAKIHCKLAEFALMTEDFNRATKEADLSIDKDPDYLKGYYWRAVVRHRIWCLNTYFGRTYAAEAVQDYVMYYTKTSRRDKDSVLGDLCTAIMLAVDSGNTSILELGKFLTRDECTAIAVTKLLSMKACNGKHLQFIIMKTHMIGSGVAIDFKCDLSELKMSELFEKKEVEVFTIEAAMNLGATIKLKDIEMAVKHISDEQTSVLEFALTACDPGIDNDIPVLTLLCSQALSLNKPEISAFLISKGAKPENENVIKSITSRNAHEGLVSHLLSTPDGCVCLLMQAIYNSSLALAKRCLKGCTSIFKEVIDLGKFLKSSKDLLCQNPDFFEQLLKLGANPNGLSDDNRPIDAVLALRSDFEYKSRLLCTLAEHGADLTKATHPRTQGTSIFHICTEVAFQHKDTQVLEKICSCYQFPEEFDTKTHATNRRGQTPYHLIMQQKQSDLAIKLCEILSKYPINPSLTDERGQRPADFKHPKFKGDKRVPILMEAAKRFQAEQSRRKARSSSKSKPKKSSSKSKNRGVPNADNNELHAEGTEANPSLEDGASGGSTSTGSSKSIPQIEDPNLRALNESMDFLSKQPSEYFFASVSYARQSSSHKHKVHHLPPESKQKFVLEVKSPVQQQIEKRINKDELDEEEENLGINKVDILANFDNESLKWEVEFPENVVKYFKGKSNNMTVRLAIKKIQCLAAGIPTKNRKLCKRVRSGKAEIYETRVTKAIRILWEVATQFSPTLTAKLRSSDKLQLQSVADKGHYLYSEVIRVWDIVEDHDNLSKSIDLAVERIKSCHQRGTEASTKVILLPSSGNSPSAGHSDDIRFPQVFTNKRLDEETKELIANQVLCCPAGSAKDDEYNVITFYPFDFSFVKSILEGEDARRDFPYKEWPKEHDIINMASRSILLLGRSGTGKTTCCLYRLWNCFQNYWSRANTIGPWYDARPLTYYDAEKNDDSDSEDESADCSTSESHTDQCEAVPDKTDDSPAAHDSADELQEEESITDLEHLHQVFITKNYVLCAQMKKRFYDLAAGSDIAKQHMPFEDTERPTSFSKLNDLAYPLFLTAREFFLLLDNSLNDDNQFFTRAPDGKLTEKIRSSDYDHEDPDTLLDLDWESDQEEGSESESSDDEAANPQNEPKVKQPQRREVTASYFVEKIWPSIHQVCEDKKIDPLLIWMEIKSFIKGSSKAVKSKEGYLTQEEYVTTIGKKMAANFVGNREEIYEVFKKYQHFIKHRAEESLFDECEFIHNLFGRLCKLKEIPFSIHSFYVDEVQDFTQAELSILLRCCKDPNNLFLTGDTAQSIMRGVSFRFSDLRSLFHSAKKQAKIIRKKAMVTVPVVDELTINFRSHSGVLRLAASVIEVLQKFFPNSFDRLPGDKGMFPGPIPTLLDSCNFSDLAIVLRGNKRESSAIEFGAHQVIIVQSEDAKKALPNELQAGIALTVFEAKGLEFDDVLLYDFFKDSKVSKEWRIVTRFIEDSPQLLASKVLSKGFENKPRPLKFDEQHHKSLNAELKYLYTAITRAKCNLWIYDSDEKDRLPMFDYWHRRGLVKIIRLNEISQKDESALFAATSTKEEWKKQGDYFKKKKLWEPAMKCYVKAEEVYLEKEAKAYCLVQQARAPNLKPRDMEELYLQAALAFLECDRSKHDVKSLRYAASFLKKAKRPNEAGLLYAKLRRHKDAVREFKKSKNFKGLVLLKEQEGNYNDAVSLLVDNGKKDDALEYAERYESEGHTLRSDLQVSSLAIKFAKEICDQTLTQRSQNRLEKLVMYMNNPTDKVNYLKIAKKYRDAFDVLCNDKKFDEAYRLCAAQGWADDGLELAEEKKNAKWVRQFTFQKAITGLITENKVDSSIIKILHSLKNSNDDQVKAKAYLIFGKSKRDFFSCRTAFNVYLSTLNAAGCIEAFNLMIQFRVTGPGSKGTDINIRQILDACSKATDISQTLERVLNHKPLSAAQEHALKQLEEVYGLQRHFSVAEKNKKLYFLIPDQHIWIDLCSGHGSHEANAESDSDGMIQIKRTKALRIISGHVQKFLKRWQEKDELQVCQIFRSHLSSFQFHKELEDRGCIRKSFKMQYQARTLYDFLRLCYSGFELSKFANGEIKQAYVIQLLVNFFRPAAALYLGVSRREMENMIKSPFAILLSQHSLKIVEKSDSDFHADNWLDAWSILSILGKKHHDSLLKQLNKCAAHAKALPLNRMPAIYLRSRGAVGHVFSFWIRACALIQSDRKVITSSKVVLHYFLETILCTRSIRLTISITNLINILTIYTTALLTLTALCKHMQRKSSNILFPNSFECVLNVFDNLGKQINGDSIRVLDACMGDEKVLKAYEKMKSNQHAVQNIQHEITCLLWQILDLLLGKHTSSFHPLQYAMKSEDCIRRGETRHCLLLVLVLFGNLSEIDAQCSPTGLQSYHNDINNAVEVLKDSIGEESQILRQACGMFSTANNVKDFFLAIRYLITTVDSRDHIVRINIQQRRWYLERAQTRPFPARPLLPTAKSQLQQVVKLEGPPSTGLLKQVVDSVFESPVPFHPASAYPAVTSSSGPQVVSINPQQNVTTSNAGLPEAPTGRDDAVQVLKPQMSIEPHEEEESRLNLEEIEDEDLKNVILSGPFVLDRQSSETTAEKENPALKEDLSMIDEQFCCFCAVPLKASEAVVPIAELEESVPDERSDDQEPISEDQDDEVKAELYVSHCVSEKHMNNVKAYENFIKSKTWYYDPLREMLSEVLRELKRFESENIAPNLRITIQEIGRELEKDERALSEIRNSAEWKEGVSRIEQDMIGCIDALITDAKDKLSKEQTRVQQLREQTTIHEEDEDNENNLDEGDGSQSDEEINKKVDPSEVKERERQRKRERKKAQNRGGKR